MSNEGDDQAWLDTLAGRDAFAGRESVGERADGAPRAATLNEARALRTALLARTRVDELSLQREIGRDGRSRAAQLLERARRDEILAPLLDRTSVAAPRKHTGLWGALLAAGIAGLAVALVWTLRPTVDAPITRSAPDAILHMVADDPAILRSQIVEALRAAGVESVTYERFGRAGLDADLPRPLTPAVRAVLERFGVAPPEDSVLRIEIAPRPKPDPGLSP